MRVLVLCFAILFPQALAAETVIYGAFGLAEEADASTAGEIPFALGVFAVSDEGGVLGVDIGFEGTKLDSTSGRTNVPVQAISYNLLLGRTVLDGPSRRMDAALLVGFRETAVSCPDSFLGYRCYADRDPDYEFTGNFGGVLTYALDRFVLGARVTTVSAQAMIGVQF